MDKQLKKIVKGIRKDALVRTIRGNSKNTIDSEIEFHYSLTKLWKEFYPKKTYTEMVKIVETKKIVKDIRKDTLVGIIKSSAIAYGKSRHGISKSFEKMSLETYRARKNTFDNALESLRKEFYPKQSYGEIVSELMQKSLL